MLRVVAFGDDVEDAVLTAVAEYTACALAYGLHPDEVEEDILGRFPEHIIDVDIMAVGEGLWHVALEPRPPASGEAA